MKFKNYLILPLIFLLPIFSYVNALTLQELRNDTNLKLVISQIELIFILIKNSLKIYHQLLMSQKFNLLHILLIIKTHLYLKTI